MRWIRRFVCASLLSAFYYLININSPPPLVHFPSLPLPSYNSQRLFRSIQLFAPFLLSFPLLKRLRKKTSWAHLLTREDRLHFLLLLLFEILVRNCIKSEIRLNFLTKITCSNLWISLCTQCVCVSATDWVIIKRLIWVYLFVNFHMQRNQFLSNERESPSSVPNTRLTFV